MLTCSNLNTFLHPSPPSQGQASVQANSAALQEHRRMHWDALQPHLTSSAMAFGIGSFVIKTGCRTPSSFLVQTLPLGSGRDGFGSSDNIQIFV